MCALRASNKLKMAWQSLFVLFEQQADVVSWDTDAAPLGTDVIRSLLRCTARDEASRR
jgi:hypothetical protein